MQKKESSKVLNNVLTITRLALVAAMYVAMSLCIQGMDYGIIQFRFSEFLVLLCFYRKDYSISMILACLIVNLFSPLGWYDIVFGTLATAVSVIPMYYMKNIYLAALLPVVSNGVIVGAELHHVFGEPLWLAMVSVAVSELIIIGIIGVVIFRQIFDRVPVLLKIIGCTKSVTHNKKTAEV